MSAKDSSVRYGAIVEARMGSTRLPGKVLAELVPGWSMVDVIVARARKATRLVDVVVATSTVSADDVLARHMESRGTPFFRGSEHLLVERILGAARHFCLDRIVRLTGDNPLIDGALIDDVIVFAERGGYDYVTTTHMGHSRNWQAERTFPRGICVEVIRRDILESVFNDWDDPFVKAQPNGAFLEFPDRFRLGAFEAEGPYRDWRHPELAFTVDTPKDLEVARLVFSALSQEDPSGFSTQAAIAYLLDHPEISILNKNLPRNGLNEIRRQVADQGRSQ